MAEEDEDGDSRPGALKFLHREDTGIPGLREHAQELTRDKYNRAVVNVLFTLRQACAAILLALPPDSSSNNVAHAGGRQALRARVQCADGTRHMDPRNLHEY